MVDCFLDGVIQLTIPSFLIGNSGAYKQLLNVTVDGSFVLKVILHTHTQLPEIFHNLGSYSIQCHKFPKILISYLFDTLRGIYLL